MTNPRTQKIFSLTWAFEPFADDPSFFTKKMFGCLAAYCNDRLVLVLAENPGDSEYRGKKYPFDIWNGVLVPTERDFHPSLLKEFSEMVNHPVLPKWLYLPMSTPNFESIAERLGQLIKAREHRIGVFPEPRKKRKKKRKSQRLRE